MKLRELYLLSHREITAYRTRSRATIITIGALFGLLLASLVILQGLENVALKYAGSATDGKVYLVSDYRAENGQDLVRQRLSDYRGIAITPTDEEATALSDSAIIAEFASVAEAYAYFKKSDSSGLHYSAAKYEIYELRGKQIATYQWFADLKDNFVRPVSIVLLVIAVFILAFTMSHILSQSTKTSMLYRSLGASKSQLLLIYLAYMLQLCCRAIIFAVAMSVILAGISTAAGWHYFSTEFIAAYPAAPHYPPILLGVNPQCLEIILWMLLSVPPSFLLCLDQFSNQKLALKLKGD